MTQHLGRTQGARYNDDFATCARTYVTLVIHMAGLNPDAILQALGWTGSTGQAAESQSGTHLPPKAKEYMSLTSNGMVVSRDLRRHLNWLLGQITAGPRAIRELREAGCDLYVWAFWVSAHGHGGPILGVDEMHALSSFGLELNFDIYFNGTEEQCGVEDGLQLVGRRPFVFTTPRDGFGERLSADTTETFHNSLRFAGQYVDAETGMYYMRARYYDPVLMRFISEDPIGIRRWHQCPRVCGWGSGQLQ